MATTELFNFRVEREVMAQIAARADDDGVSKSEWVRSVIAEVLRGEITLRDLGALAERRQPELDKIRAGRRVAPPPGTAGTPTSPLPSPQRGERVSRVILQQPRPLGRIVGR